MVNINWKTKVINIPQSYLTDLGGNVYELNVNTFRLTLKDLEDDEDGMVFIRTHNHNTEVVLAGVTYARVVEIINGYTITFEDGQYAVNIVGANSNISDVVNVNQVSIRASNSAGLVSTSISTNDVNSIKNAVWDESTLDHSDANTYGKLMNDLEKLVKQIKSLTSANL